MEGLTSVHKRVAGIDVHRMLHVVTVFIEHPDGRIEQTTHEYSGVQRQCRELTAWLVKLQIELVVMESTSIYWKPLYAYLERAGLTVWLVNAHFVKHVEGRKTDVGDSQWLAALARFGLLRASFIPPQDFRELRLLSRYRRKLIGMRASEINRLQKTLDDAGIKLGCVVSDIKGVSAQAMVAGLIEGKPIDHLLTLARGKLQLKRDDLEAALEGDLSERHLFALMLIQNHIAHLDQQIAQLDSYLLNAMTPYQWAHRLLQTIPGIDQIASAMILIEIGIDMTQFGSADRLASWAALCPGNRESAGKRKSGRTRKGNAIIRYLLCECANAARMTKSTLASKYKCLMVRKSHKKSIIAIAHKMIRLIYLMLTRKEAYHDPKVDYEAMSAKKNAPRWIKQLKLIGKWPTSPATTATSTT